MLRRSRESAGPIRDTVPGPFRGVRLIGVDLGIDDRHREVPPCQAGSVYGVTIYVGPKEAVPRHEGRVNLGAGDTAVREGDSIAVSTQGLQITRFSRSARTSSALKLAKLVNTVSICSPMSGARLGVNGESDRRTGQPITENRPRVGWSMS